MVLVCSDDESVDDSGSDLGWDSEDISVDSNLVETVDVINDQHCSLLKSIDRFANEKDIVNNKTRKNFPMSMDTLLKDLDEPKLVKSNVLKIQKSDAPAHVESVTSNRLERSQFYDNAKVSVNKWQDIVQHNKHVQVLDFANDKRNTVSSSKCLVNNYHPLTALESDVQMVLVRNGTSERIASNMEQDELQARDVTEVEMKARQSELAKIKSLLFYEQMKRHRLNKIKSKVYHNIKKRKRLRNKADTEDEKEETEFSTISEEQKEDLVLNRIKERMAMRHKSSSKFAKSNGHNHKNFRMAHQESILLGQELMQKVDTYGNVKSDEEMDHMMNDTERYSMNSTSTVAKDFLDLIQNENNNQHDKVSSSNKFAKLFDMKFMKKAEEQQRDRALLDAEIVLREVADADDNDYLQESTLSTVETGNNLSWVADTKSASLLSKGKKKLKVSHHSIDLSTTAAIENTTKSNNPWLDQQIIPNSAILQSDAKSSFTSHKKKTYQISNNAIVPITGSNEKYTPQNLDNVNIPSISKKKTADRIPLMLQRSQAEMINIAFSGPDLAEEFETSRSLSVNEVSEAPVSSKNLGWGDWTGPGVVSGTVKKTSSSGNISKQSVQGGGKQKRGTAVLNVMISDRKIKTSSKFKIADIPHPYTSREQYERALQMPLGDDWNASNVVKSSTQPEIKKRAGRVIMPPKLKR